MIDDIALKGLGVVRDAEAEFAPGFTAVTGETGAGKTLVLSGIGLLLGARADAGLVSAANDKASSTGHFTLPKGHPAVTAAEAAGAEVDDVIDADSGVASKQLVITRHVSSNGRSKAYVGGHAVPVKTLIAITEELVAVHGQSDQLRLKSSARQRDVVDTFGGDELRSVKASYLEVYDEHRRLVEELRQADEEREQRAAEAMVLRDGLEAIEEVEPVVGEEDELVAAIYRLDNVEQLRSSAQLAKEALVGSDSDAGGSALAALEVAKEALERADDDQLQALSAQVASALYTAQDAGSEVRGYLSDLQADPAKLARMRDRLAALRSLQPRYGNSDAEILEWSQRAAARLALIDESPEARAALEARRDELSAELDVRAHTLRGHRSAAAATLSDRVTEELGKLAMPNATFLARVSPADHYAAHGADTVELLLAPHPGAEPTPLGKGASGGELSRVMLALEVVMAGAVNVPSFIFDEIDAGVGGAAATAIGDRLAQLAKFAQVIVVTHLPQVAAWADQHLVLVKRACDDGTTRTEVDAVAGESRVKELARMLAGHADSVSAQEHAQELLAQAAQAAEQTRS